MKVAALSSWTRPVRLRRPYAIAFDVTDRIDLVVVRVETACGAVGLGTATPEPQITGETAVACAAALAPANLAWLCGCEADPEDLLRMAGERLAGTPGALAALDMAIHDAWARTRGLPLVELLGRVHDELPTSITIGIQPVDGVLQDADEYLARGFNCLKVKIGRSVSEDVECLRRLRAHVGDRTTIRVDANQGYDLDAFSRWLDACADLDLELVEQPLPPGAEGQLRGLPIETRRLLAADESLMGEADARTLLVDPRPYQTFVIKLMKCGGIAPARMIAGLADASGVDLMWGCMDESVVGIAAALHVAFACPATRYLDLDGSLDLAEDVARGCFVLEGGVMRTNGQPGLGVEWIGART